MAATSRKEAFRYGFYVFSYWLVLLAFSGALVAAGAWIIREQVGQIGPNQEGALAALGGFVTVLGVFVFGSGQAGLAYKVVADGVATGTPPLRAGGGSAGRTDSTDGSPERGDDTQPPAGAASTRSPPETDDRPDGEAPVESGVGDDQPTGVRQPDDGPLTDDQPAPDAGVPDGASGGADAGRTPPATTAGGQPDGDADADSPRAPATQSDSDPDGEHSDRPVATAQGEDESSETAPAEVASESEIAAELGFEEESTDNRGGGDRRSGSSPDAAPRSETGGQRRDSGSDPLADSEPTDDDPLAPDSDFTPRDSVDDPATTRETTDADTTGRSSDPATAETPVGEDADTTGRSSDPATAETPVGEDADAADDPFVDAGTVESRGDEADADADDIEWTTGEGHMGGTEDRDEE